MMRRETWEQGGVFVPRLSSASCVCVCLPPPPMQGLSRSSSLLVPAMGLPVTSPYVVKATGQRVWLTLKPACSDQLAPGKPVGVPSWVLSETWPTGVTVGSVADDEVCRSDPAACKGIAKCFYFVVVLPTTSRSMTLHSSHTAGIKASSSGTALDRVASTSKASVVTRRGQPGMVASTSISSSGSGDPSTGHSSLCCYGDYDLPPDLASSLTMGELIGSGSFSKGEPASPPPLPCSCVPALPPPSSTDMRTVFVQFIAACGEKLRWPSRWLCPPPRRLSTRQRQRPLRGCCLSTRQS